MLLPPLTIAESLFSYRDDARSERMQVDLALLTALNIEFATVDRRDEEEATFASLVGSIDDGESEALAVAHHRSFRLFTDDVAAVRMALKLRVGVVTILDLLKEWGKMVEEKELRAAARSLRRRGNYAAPRQHGLRDWYVGLLQ